MEGNGQKKVRKAVIPIAGNGTRMFPETFFIKKVMLPVMDDKGVVKPALLYMLEELNACGIEEIYLIVGIGETEDYNHIFNFSYNKGYVKRLPENVRNYYDEIYEIGKKIRLVVQKEKKGFGHAVYQARKHLNGEPAVLLLGDFLYKSNIERSCTQQAIDAYVVSGGKSVIGVKRIDVKDCVSYGIVHGMFRANEQRIMDAYGMVEKPDVEYARKNLMVEGSCFATFGNYVLTNEVFEYLEDRIIEKERTNDNSETDLTGAFMSMAKKGNLVGVDIDGRSFDVGIPNMYYKTFTEFAKS